MGAVANGIRAAVVVGALAGCGDRGGERVEVTDTTPEPPRSSATIEDFDYQLPDKIRVENGRALLELTNEDEVDHSAQVVQGTDPEQIHAGHSSTGQSNGEHAGHGEHGGEMSEPVVASEDVEIPAGETVVLEIDFRGLDVLADYSVACHEEDHEAMIEPAEFEFVEN